MNLKIRKGDTVEIISGRRDEVGKQGEVIRVLPEERRVVVLAEGEDVEADLLGLLRDRDGGADALVLGRDAAGDGVAGDVADREDAELHHWTAPVWLGDD